MLYDVFFNLFMSHAYVIARDVNERNSLSLISLHNVGLIGSIVEFSPNIIIIIQFPSNQNIQSVQAILKNIFLYSMHTFEYWIALCYNTITFIHRFWCKGRSNQYTYLLIEQPTLAVLSLTVALVELHRISISWISYNPKDKKKTDICYSFHPSPRKLLDRCTNMLEPNSILYVQRNVCIFQ